MFARYREWAGAKTMVSGGVLQVRIRRFAPICADFDAGLRACSPCSHTAIALNLCWRK
jgi:hypothetical protein